MEQKLQVEIPDVTKIFKGLQLLNNFKHVQRTGPNLFAGIPNHLIESLAEHSYRVTYMCMIFAKYVEDVNMSKILQFCITHDWGESIINDVPTSSPSFKSFFEDDIRVIYKQAEYNALSEILNDFKLDMIELNENERDLFDLCDILDVIFEMIDFRQLGMRHTWIEKMFKVQINILREYQFNFVPEIIEKSIELFEQGAMSNEYLTKKTANI
ncbi:MAG: HD domain-containing protein [bacterium]